MRGIKSGYGNAMLPVWAVFNLYVIYVITSIPGLAISPIMGTLQSIFPGTTQLETQFLTLGPNIAAIPFVFLGGAIGTKFNNMKMLNWTCLFYGIGGALFFIAPNMITLIILSFLIGIAAGIISPLASAFIADMFDGKERSKQYGATSAVLNVVLMLSVIATGYLAKINWRLPFVIYLLPFVPLFFAAKFKRFIKEPTDIKKAANTPKVKYKFSQQVNVPALVRYCVFYFVITLVVASVSLYIPFLFKNSETAGNLTSIIYFGIAASGFSLNWALKFLKKSVAFFCIFAMLVGIGLIWVTQEVFVVGLGIFIATYFYGIAQPYYYNRLSNMSTRVALTMTLAIFAIMNSLGAVLAPFIIDGLASVFGDPTSTHPLMAFKIGVGLLFLGTVAVVLREIIKGRHSAAAHPATAAVEAEKQVVKTLPKVDAAVKPATDSTK